MTSIQGFSLPLPIAPPSGASGAASLGAAGGAQGAQPFKNVLLEAIDQVNNVQSQADQAVQQLVTGGDVNPAEVLTTLQKADMSFRMMMQIRNKLVQAYQEVSNIRI